MKRGVKLTQPQKKLHSKSPALLGLIQNLGKQTRQKSSIVKFSTYL